MSVCMCVRLCLCVCVSVFELLVSSGPTKLHHPFSECVPSLHICMQEGEFTLYQCGVTQDDQEHCNCAWLPLQTPTRLQVRGPSPCFLLLLFSFVLLSSPFAPLNVLYLPKSSSEMLHEIMHPFPSSLPFHSHLFCCSFLTPHSVTLPP